MSEKEKNRETEKERQREKERERKSTSAAMEKTLVVKAIFVVLRLGVSVAWALAWASGGLELVCSSLQ